MSFISNLFGSSEKRPSPNQIYLEYPLGIRYTLLLNFEDKTGKADYLKDILPYQQEASRIENIIVERNMNGIESEKSGQIENAIKLYEQNVTDYADTPHPYNRLRVIYSKLEQYDEAIRVCKAYVEMSIKLGEAVNKELNNPKLAKELSDPGEFINWVKKLQKKKNPPTKTSKDK